MFQELQRRQDDTQVDWASLLQTHVIVKQISVSMTVLVWYDMMSTLATTIRILSRPRWDPSKLLFIANRFYIPLIQIFAAYTNFIPSPSPAVCRAAPLVQIPSFTIAVATVFLGFYHRLRAVSRYRTLPTVAAVIGISILVANTVYLLWAELIIEGIVHPFPPPFTGCLWIPPKPIWFTVVDTGIFESSVLAMILYYSVPAMRLHGTYLITVLVQDGLYYLCAVVIIKVFAILASLLPSWVPFVAGNAMLILYNILSCRIQVRLFNAITKPQDLGTAFEFGDISSTNREGSRPNEIGYTLNLHPDSRDTGAPTPRDSVVL